MTKYCIVKIDAISRDVIGVIGPYNGKRAAIDGAFIRESSEDNYIDGVKQFKYVAQPMD